ncbi:alpha/beta fold hydrolase [Amycolatopsis sacchari]|uniref:Pimeloyl-ACP methyl ester carboxylesterase n=1 Tax=Amycolatopsis sacchari TaxID=115433 RepID=A0A1I3ZAW0_9PSEU|nr:alpha/beta fold hydrolase [Amycolatopsis sacchari]SFK40841.1 Pimeloyl-ACP methyl ester carboxylesterase [Amycolatopsis sacchari]
MGDYATVNGQQLYYEVHGEGRPVVLLHGGLLTFESSFGPLLPRLTKSRQVIGVELQGHGHTPDTDRPPSLPAFADDVAGLLDHLGLARADLFGFSLGGLVALQLAVSRPERVDRLVLASAHYRPDGYHDEIRDPALQANSTRMPTADDFRDMVTAYQQVAPDPSRFDAVAVKTSALVGAFTGWSPEQLRGLRAPTLLVFGDHDFVRLEHATEMAGLIPEAHLAILPHTTHTQVLRRTDLVAPMVESFLD